MKNAVSDLKDANKKLKTAHTNYNNVCSRLKSQSGLYSNISNTLTLSSDNLEVLISKLALMEDGLEKAVDLYLQCERKIAYGETQIKSGNMNNITTYSKDEKDENNFWDNLKDWLDTGVWNDPEKADRIRNDKAMANELKDLLKSERYSKKEWKKASVEEREQILKELFDDMQSIYGVSVENLIIESIESETGTTYGAYNDYYSTIFINKDLLNDPSYYDKIMETMSHEMRHAYQHAVVNNPDDYKVDDKTVQEWRENFDDYKDPDEDGYDKYRNQPVEVDDRKFADWVI